MWLAAESKQVELSESEIIRQLILQRMKQATPKEQRAMRGYAQVGHDAVVVWSPTFEMHQRDHQAALDRGCKVRGQRSSFQQSSNGRYFSWLDAPLSKCELCEGGRCQKRK